MKLVVSEPDAGKRLDSFLTATIDELNRSSVDKLIDNSSVKVNRKTQTKAGYKLKVDDQIEINIDIKEVITPQKVDLPVIYEDENCIVIDKPEGILTHSKGEANNEPTVATFIANKLSGLSGNRGGIVHRLDRATSGVIICAKNEETLKFLQKQFSERKVTKKYIEITKSGISPKQAVIDIPIGRSTSNPKLFETTASGKPAQTEYNVLNENSEHCLVELKPRTGRTHQLRVHLKYLGFPILGDDFYGGRPSKRLFLHAVSLELRLPGGEKKRFESKLPTEFSEIMK